MGNPFVKVKAAMKLRQVTISQLFLLITWAGIGCYWLAQHMQTPPYQGPIIEQTGTIGHALLKGGFVTDISIQIVDSSPTWHPSARNPPVSALEAIVIAEEMRTQILPDKPHCRWAIRSLQLCPLDCEENKWCWRVVYSASSHHAHFGPAHFQIHVLMDGVAIPPEIFEDGGWIARVSNSSCP